MHLYHSPVSAPWRCKREGRALQPHLPQPRVTRRYLPPPPRLPTHRDVRMASGFRFAVWEVLVEAPAASEDLAFAAAPCLGTLNRSGEPRAGPGRRPARSPQQRVLLLLSPWFLTAHTPSDPWLRLRHTQFPLACHRRGNGGSER